MIDGKTGLGQLIFRLGGGGAQHGEEHAPPVAPLVFSDLYLHGKIVTGRQGERLIRFARIIFLVEGEGEVIVVTLLLNSVLGRLLQAL